MLAKLSENMQLSLKLSHDRRTQKIIQPYSIVYPQEKELSTMQASRNSGCGITRICKGPETSKKITKCAFDK